MPWSVIENVPPIMNEIHRLQPERMIELGVGFGKYGTLCRETLDGMYGRCRKAQWKRKIYGIEGWTDYFNPCWSAYDEVNHGDFSQMEIAGYDLVLMVDSFEHLEPERGQPFLEKLLANNRHVIISVPNGECHQPEAVHGNAYEIHRATYFPNSFDRYGAKVLHLGYCMVVSIPGRG
jgi:hypothetical protein